MDLNNYVLSDGVVTPEQQRAIAGSLRNRDQMGTILALSGDKVLAPVGQQYVATASKGAQQGLTHNYYQGMLRDNEKNRHLRKALADQNTQLGYAQIASQDRATTARMGALEKPIRKDLKEAIQFSVSSLQSMDVLEKSFDPKWVSRIPGMGALKKWGARVAPGLVGEDVVAFGQWHAALNREVESGIRNKLYGSALTASEIKSWRDMTIDPAANMVQIKAWFDRNKAKMQQAAEQNVAVGSYSYPEQTRLLLMNADPTSLPSRQATPATPVQPQTEDDSLAYEVLED